MISRMNPGIIRESVCKRAGLARVRRRSPIVVPYISRQTTHVSIKTFINLGCALCHCDCATCIPSLHSPVLVGMGMGMGMEVVE